MGIQINGQIDNISATDGSLTISGAELPNVTNLNATGIVTASGIVVSAGSTSAPSISPSGDSNTGIFFPSPDTIAFGEGGTEALRVGSTGNIGIGTDNVNQRITIQNSASLNEIQFRGSEYTNVYSTTDNGFDIGINNPSSTGSFRILTANTSRFSVDSSGRTTLPYQPSFYTIGTNYTQSTGTSIIIPNVVSYNQGSHYNGSTGRFTAPIAGRYIFGFWGLSYPHNTEVNHIQGFVNGSGAGQLVQFNGTSTQHEECSGSLLLNLNANDIFDWRYTRGSGTAAAYSSQWNMWGYLLG